MRKVFWWWVSFVIIMAGCGTINVPTQTCPPVITQVIRPEKVVKWPEEPCRHLKELTAGLPEDRKLPTVLAANRACINNLEEALHQAGVKEIK